MCISVCLRVQGDPWCGLWYSSQESLFWEISSKWPSGCFPYSFWLFPVCFSFCFIVIKLLILVSGTFLTQLLVSAPQFKNVLFLWFWWSNIHCCLSLFVLCSTTLQEKRCWFKVLFSLICHLTEYRVYTLQYTTVSRRFVCLGLGFFLHLF